MRPGPARPVVDRVLVDGLTSPWGLAFLPDGAALVSERDTARIRFVPRGGGSARTLGTVPGVRHGGEGGLLGLAVGPGFAASRWVYAYYTTGQGNVVARIPVRGTGGPTHWRLGPPEMLVHGITSASRHNGGRIAVGPDGMLYVSTGDAGRPDLAPRPGSLNGKILRVTLSGRPAPGNPRPGSPVYTRGHRNVEGLAWDAAGRLWASELGEHSFDELNRIRAGRDYGWPTVEGFAHGRGHGAYVDPAVVWRTDEASPSGLAYSAGSLWMAALHGERLWQVPVSRDGTTGTPRDWFVGRWGRLRTVAAAPDGSLWLMTSSTDGRGDPLPGGDRIIRLRLR